MTVAEAVKDSKSGGLFNRALIEYGQSQLREDEDLVCAAIVYVTRRAADHDGATSGYLARAGVSSKIKMLLCVNDFSLSAAHFLCRNCPKISVSIKK